MVWQQCPLLILAVATLMNFTDTLWSLVAADLFLPVACTTSALVHCGSVFNFHLYCKIKTYYNREHINAQTGHTGLSLYELPDVSS